MVELELKTFDTESIQVSKIKVLLTYIVYPFAIASYFRKALEHRSDVDLRVAGPYTGTWIPWMWGMNLLPKYAIPPDVPIDLSPNVREYNYENISSRLGDWKPDIIIQIDANLHFRYRPHDGMVVTVGTDPHVLNDFYDVPRSYSDKFFNMQLCYSKPNDIYLPYAYSRYDHYPELNVEKDTDAVLIGMPYAQRVEWVQELRERGVSVIFENGPVFDEARALYNRGRIGLNCSSMDDLNARAFEIPALGLCPVMNVVPDMENILHNGFHYLGFSNMQEAIEQVVWAKEHPDDSHVIAHRAYNQVVHTPNSYDDRVQQILSECGFV